MDFETQAGRKCQMMWERTESSTKAHWCVCLCNIHSVWSLCVFTVARARTVAWLSVANVIRARQRAGLDLNHYKTGRGLFSSSSHLISQQDRKSVGTVYNSSHFRCSKCIWFNIEMTLEASACVDMSLMWWMASAEGMLSNLVIKTL